MIKNMNIFIGGIDLSNDPYNHNADFNFPIGQPSSYLMNGRLCRFFIEALNTVAGLNSLPSVGDTDACFSFEQADAALKVMREKSYRQDDDNEIAELEFVFSNWREVPNSGPSVWWNAPPYGFNLLPIKTLSRIENIDVTKPLEFYGSKTTVIGPFTKTTQIPIEDGIVLMEYLKSCCWRLDFDNHLQYISKTDAGEDLLTGWLPMELFIDFVEGTSQLDLPIREVSIKLARMIDGWADMGVQRVNFVGFALVQ